MYICINIYIYIYICTLYIYRVLRFKDTIAMPSLRSIFTNSLELDANLYASAHICDYVCERERA